MSKVFIEESTLTSIGNAIREKNGTTELIAPQNMGAAIAAIEAGGGGGYEPTDDELKYSSHASSSPIRHYNSYFPFTDGANYWILKQYGDRCSFNLYDLTSGFFARFPYKCFDANIPYYYNFALQYLFRDSVYLEEITGSLLSSSSNKHSSRMAGMFSGCNRLRTIGDNFLPDGFLFISSKTSYFGEYDSMFRDCYSLRELPKFYNTSLVYGANSKDIKLAGTSYFYSYTFSNCYALNKIENLRVVLSQLDGSLIKYNGFDGTFSNCHNLSKLTFDVNEDGTPKVANWNKQTIDLSQYVGYAKSASYMTGYNSGLTADGNINIDGTAPTFQAYRTETINDYYATNGGCSKYGHLEAVETINSLPDTSAAGGNNTIKFYGSQGYYTNYLKGRCGQSPMVVGTINKLTEEEIAVAAAKGWTVSLT